MASKSRGLLWTDKELDVMLDSLYQVQAGRKVMTSTNLETSSIFQKVSELMKERGFERTFGQIRSKFKKEKGIFYDAMEEYRGLPPRSAWGPRFHLLHKLWEQAERPDYLQRRPASCGKAKKRECPITQESEDQEASSTMGQASSCEKRTAEGGNPEAPHIAEHHESETSARSNKDNADSNAPHFREEGREPTYSELVEEVLNLGQELNCVKKSFEFLRQGLVRIKYEWDQKKIADALKVQAKESDSNDEDTEDSVQRESTEISEEEPEKEISHNDNLEQGREQEEEVITVVEEKNGSAANNQDGNVISILESMTKGTF